MKYTTHLALCITLLPIALEAELQQELMRLRISLQRLQIILSGKNIAQLEAQKQAQEKESPDYIQYLNKYPTFFEKFPEKYRIKVFNYYKFTYDTPQELNDAFKNGEVDPFPVVSRFAILDSFNKIPLYKKSEPAGISEEEFSLSSNKSGYQFVFSKQYLRGNREQISNYIYSIDAILWNKEHSPASVTPEEEKELQDKALKLTGQYKIHLMPTKNNIILVFIKFLEQLTNDNELQEVTNAFKIYFDLKLYYDKVTALSSSQEIFPVIVIYPADGKEHAQKLLDKMIKLYDGMEGLDITPRYNQKVTSLIYFAQGDGDFKKEQRFKDLFEQPAQIYYNCNLLGSYQDYRLTFPGSENIPYRCR